MKQLSVFVLAGLVLLFTWGVVLADGFGYTVNTTGDYTGPVVQQVDSNPAPVPEPATLLLLGTGLVGLAFVRRKMK